MKISQVLFVYAAILTFFYCRKNYSNYEAIKLSEYDLYGVEVYTGDTVVVVGGRKYDVGVLLMKSGRGGEWVLKQKVNAALNTAIFRYGWRGFAAGYKGIILSGYDAWDTIEMLLSPSFSVIYDILDLDTIVYFVGGGEGFTKGTIFRARPGFDWFEELYLPYVLRSICFDGKYIYAASVGRIYYSTNGRDWDSLFIGNDLLVDKAYFQTEGCYFIGTRGTVVNAYNGNVKLVKDQPAVPLRTLVAATPIQNKILGLTGNGKILLFENDKWKVLTSLPSSQCFDLACNDLNICYVACESGTLYKLELSQLF